MAMINRMYDSATSWQAGVLAADDAEVYLVRRNEHPTVTMHPGTKLEHGAVTGTGFVIGETVTGGTSARTGVVAYIGSGFLYVVGEVGASAWDTETITGGTSASNADVSATDTSECKVEESHSPHDSNVVAYKDWDYGDQTTALTKCLYGGARWLRFSTVSGFTVFEVVR
jgi:hypothetical protein